ncbi:MAG TPA: prephenate dehydratase [Bacillales bacterium]|nr:prephenate dehydratase [Bacillales bacterium]
MREKIGYLGPKGTFTETAASALFPDEELIPCTTIPHCMEAVNEGSVDYCVVPLENAIEGSVNLTMDYLFHEKVLSIVGEVVVPIRQHFMVHPDRVDDWRDVEKVYSHPQAISQCHHFLKNTLPEAETTFTNSTASAAEHIKNHPGENAGALGNSLAAKMYGLVPVRQDVHDYDNNHTRFVVLHRENVDFQSDNAKYIRDKTTMTVTLPSDFSGALHQVLSAFAWRKLNMSKIESRPTKTGLGNYFFIIDVEKKMDDIMIPGVQKELEALGCHVHIVGSYPCYRATDILMSSGVNNIVGVHLFLSDD